MICRALVTAALVALAGGCATSNPNEAEGVGLAAQSLINDAGTNPNNPGTPSYCTPQFPCEYGGGDCDTDSDCATGFVCLDDVGADYGMPASYDVRVLDPCRNGVQDGDETEVDVGPSCNPNNPGTPSYCTPQFPCRYGAGDCDNDADCQGGLRCAEDVGASFGLPANYDVCVFDPCRNGVQDGDETEVDVGPSCNPNNPGTPSYCTSQFPCGYGGGDCDSDTDCAPGLACMDGLGADYGMPANYDVCVFNPCRNGVQDGDETAVDVGPSCNPNNQGTPSYCTPHFRCGHGGGDCDSDSDCATGFVCMDDVGADYGMPANYDVCVPDPCRNGVQDGAETAVDVGPSCNPNDPGTPSYCTPQFPCAYGGSDCDSDADCQSGLLCAEDVGASYGLPANYDVCVPDPCNNGVQDGDETEVDVGPSCNPNNPGTPSYCTPQFPCGYGGGDCDSDADCATGFVCVADIGSSFGMPANYDVCIHFGPCYNRVQDGDETAVDYGGSCPNPYLPGHASYCSVDYPCESGNGDCDSDADCIAGLVCMHDVGADYGKPANYDVCAQP